MTTVPPSRSPQTRPATSLRNRRAPPATRGLTDASRAILLQIAGFGLLFSVWLGLLGPISPLLLMASFGAIVVLTPQQAVDGLLRAWPLLLIGALACLSALWSTAPWISLRYGIQLAITIAAAITLASALKPRHIVRLLLLSGLVVLVLCLLSGRQGGSTSGPVLIGILGSKNEMGSLCFLVVCSGLGLAFTSEERPAIRLAALAGAALGLLVLLGTFATGAVLGVLIFTGCAVGIALASRLPAASRFALLLGALAFLVPLWLIRADLQRLWEYFVVDVLRKDMGLTGRDYLWAHADRLIADRPVLGYGYRSTWLSDTPETLGLLRWAGLSNGAGFNFHDSFREWAVDFGLLGAAVVATAVFIGLYKIVRKSLIRGVTAPVIFLAAMGITVLVRAKVENVLGPFGSSTVLIIVILAVGYMSWQDSGPVPAARTRPRPPRRVAARLRSPAG